MRKNWLRGILLGLSMGLLLSGGVALSGSLGIDVLFAESCEEDFDGDGIPDCEDECPEQPGPRSNDGCPLPQEPEEDFVPELGTIMLLGSGLAGMAGYATLRWRTRE